MGLGRPRPRRLADGRAHPGRRRAVRASHRHAVSRRDRRLSGRHVVRPRPGRRPDHRRVGRALNARGAARRVERGARRARGVRDADRRLRRPPGRAGPCPRGARRDRRHERPPDRRPRVLPGRLEQRAETEHALREITGRLVSIRQPDDLLQQVVDETGRLVHADGTILSRIEDDGVLHWRYDDGLQRRFEPGIRARPHAADRCRRHGVGPSRKVGRSSATATSSTRSPARPNPTIFSIVSGFRSMIGTPISGEHGPVGALEVYSTHEDASARRTRP